MEDVAEMSSLVGGRAFRARPSRINFYSLPGSICSVHSVPITTVATEGMVMTILPLLTIRQINCEEMDHMPGDICISI